MSNPIIVKHSQGEYPIHIAAHLSQLQPALAVALDGVDHAIIVANESVMSAHSAQLQEFIASVGILTQPILIPDGEQVKTLAHLEQLCVAFSKQGLSRQSVVVAIGGGVTTDLAGFAAACYMRGIGCIQVPTTLLAQVDASIGGKTAVNITTGKNLVGAFHQPLAVLISTDFLATLPAEEISCGYAEIIKHALLADMSFFEMLEASLINGAASITDEKLQEIISRACHIKVDIVEDDERERIGRNPQRALLNLGHTFAHALEASAQYQSIKHGQAVAKGIAIAAYISYMLGELSEEQCSRIVRLLVMAGLSCKLADDLDIDNMVDFISRDKKKHGAGVPLILLKDLGTAYVSEPYNSAQMKDLISRAVAFLQ